MFENICITLLKFGQIYSFFLQIWECRQIILIKETLDITIFFKVIKIQFIEVFIELRHVDEVEKNPELNAAAERREAEKLVLFRSSDQE